MLFLYNQSGSVFAWTAAGDKTTQWRSGCDTFAGISFEARCCESVQVANDHHLKSVCDVCAFVTSVMWASVWTVWQQSDLHFTLPVWCQRLQYLVFGFPCICQSLFVWGQTAYCNSPILAAILLHMQYNHEANKSSGLPQGLWSSVDGDRTVQAGTGRASDVPAEASKNWYSSRTLECGWWWEDFVRQEWIEDLML